MVYEFKFPDVGEGITEGKLVKWTKKIGDKIQQDETIAEVETDKAIVELPSPVTGTIKEFKHEEGDDIIVGNVLVIIDNGSHTNSNKENITQLTQENVNNDAKNQEEQSKEEIRNKEKTKPTNENPKENEQIKDNRNEHQTKNLQRPEQIDEHQTIQKTNTTNTGKIIALPKIRKIAKEKGIDLTTIKGTGRNGMITEADLIGQKIETKTQNDISTEQKENKTNTKAHPVVQAIQKQNLNNNNEPHNHNSILSLEKINATPTIKEYIRTTGIDIQKLQGIQNITKEKIDEIRGIKKTGNNNPENNATNTEIQETNDNNKLTNTNRNKTIDGEHEIQKLTPIRKQIIQHLRASLQNQVSVTTTQTIDITKIQKIREEYNSIENNNTTKNTKNTKNKKNNEANNDTTTIPKISILSIVTKALVKALKKHPIMNSELNGEEIIIKKFYNIGIAVDTKYGLVVVNIPNCEHKNIIAIAEEIKDKATRARNKKIKPDELKGSTFSITNIGSIGGEIFTPIINYPETAILGMGKMITTEKKQKIIFSLTFDHQVVDGAEAQRFQNTLTELIENPNEMLLEME